MTLPSPSAEEMYVEGYIWTGKWDKDFEHATSDLGVYGIYSNVSVSDPNSDSFYTETMGLDDFAWKLDSLGISKKHRQSESL